MLEMHVGSGVQVVGVCLVSAVRMGNARGWLVGARGFENRWWRAEQGGAELGEAAWVILGQSVSAWSCEALGKCLRQPGAEGSSGWREVLSAWSCARELVQHGDLVATGRACCLRAERRLPGCVVPGSRGAVDSWAVAL